MVQDLHYRFSHTVIYSETDLSGSLALPACSSLFQEAALLQAEVLGFGETYCRRENRMWVLSRLHLKIERPVVHREVITVETWPKAPRGPLAMRDYLILDGSGAVRVRATSSWLLLDTATMRPVRPEQLFGDFDFSGAGDALAESAPKVQIPADAVPVSEFAVTARYSDLDAQDHVNNTRYVRWLLDCLTPGELAAQRPAGFSVNYSRAAAWQEGIRIQRFNLDGRVLVRGFLENGAESFTAELVFRAG
jgi:acyl-ACP thioesterase